MQLSCDLLHPCQECVSYTYRYTLRLPPSLLLLTSSPTSLLFPTPFPRLSEQAQRHLQEGEKFEDILLGMSRPTMVVQRYQELYSQERVEALDAIEGAEGVNIGKEWGTGSAGRRNFGMQLVLDVLKVCHSVCLCVCVGRGGGGGGLAVGGVCARWNECVGGMCMQLYNFIHQCQSAYTHTTPSVCLQCLPFFSGEAPQRVEEFTGGEWHPGQSGSEAAGVSCGPLPATSVCHTRYLQHHQSMP